MSTTQLDTTTATQEDQPLKGTSMTTLHYAHSSEAAARRAIESLRAGGVPADGFRLLVGSPLRDVRRETVGGFAGPVGPDDPVGTFAGGARAAAPAAPPAASPAIPTDSARAPSPTATGW